MHYPTFIPEYVKYMNRQDEEEYLSTERAKFFSLPPYLQTLYINNIMTTSNEGEMGTFFKFPPQYNYLTCIFLPIIEFIQKHKIYVPLSSILNFYNNIYKSGSFRILPHIDLNCCHNSKNLIHSEQGEPCNLCLERCKDAVKYLEKRVNFSIKNETKSIEVKNPSDSVYSQKITVLENKYRKLIDYVEQKIVPRKQKQCHENTHKITVLENKYRELIDYVSFVEQKMAPKKHKQSRKSYYMILGCFLLVIMLYLYYKIFPTTYSSALILK